MTSRFHNYRHIVIGRILDPGVDFSESKTMDVLDTASTVQPNAHFEKLLANERTLLVKPNLSRSG